MVPQTLGSYNAQLRQMRFLNGSVIKFGHFQGGVAAEDEYQGQEYDWIFMDEATQFTEYQFRYLGGILRGVNKIPKRFFLTCNPGGVGHRWVKRLFIDRDFRTNSANPEENENPDDYSFVFASVEDNTELMKSSPGYVQMLSALPENMRRAHRYGDWDALSGSFFPELTSEKHVVPDFALPAEWQRYRAFDYGLDMFSCGWFAVDPDGRSYLYREVNMPGQVVSEAAGLMREMTLPGERIVVTFAPPDMWSRQKDTGKTMAELFLAEGIPIVRASNSRVQGWLQIKELLKPRSDGVPSLRFFRSCGETFGSMQAIAADERNPNDCAREPHDVTHACDMLRYFAISRTLPGELSRALEEAEEDEDEREDYEEFMTGGEVTSSYMSY